MQVGFKIYLGIFYVALWNRRFMLCDISNPLDNNNQGRCLLGICDSYDLDSLSNTPTRISSQRSSCLNVILTNVPGYFTQSGILEVGLIN